MCLELRRRDVLFDDEQRTNIVTGQSLSLTTLGPDVMPTMSFENVVVDE